MIPQRIMQSSIARADEPWIRRGAAHRDTTATISHTKPSPRSSRNLLLISRPAERRRLRWPEHTVGYQVTNLLKVACE